ncbi:right-handed parallel beta-helix repeat-containing protein, partial [Helicobacter pylori]
GEVTAELTGTKIVGGGNEKSTGVYAMGVGEMTVALDNVRISKVGKGVSVEGKGSLTIRDGSVDFTGAHGVYVGSGVKSASLTGTKIVGGGSGVGVNILGGEVTLEGVGISKVKTGVVMVGVGGTLTISGSSTIDFKGDGVGVGVLGGVKRVSLKDVTIKGEESGTGVYAMGVGEMAVRLDNVRISKVAKGVSVEGKGSLTVGKGSVEFKGAHGVYVGKKVTSASLNDVTIKGDGKGKGVYAMGGTVSLADVRISGVEMGVMMLGTEGKSLAISGSSTVEFKGDGVGVGVLGGVTRVSLMRTVITGEGSGSVGSMGVYAMGVGTKEMTVRLEDVRISKVGMGVVMGQGKSLMISGSSSIEFNGAHGVYAGYMETVNLTGTRIMGEGKGYGIYATGTGEMTLNGVGISRVEMGVYARKGKSLTISGSSSIDFKGE